MELLSMYLKDKTPEEREELLQEAEKIIDQEIEAGRIEVNQKEN